MSGDSSFEHVDAVDKKNDSFEMVGDAEMAEIDRNIEEGWEFLTRQDYVQAAHDTYSQLYKQAIKEHMKMTGARESMGNLSQMRNGLAGFEYKQHMMNYTTFLKKMIIVRKKTGDETLERMLEGAVKTDIKIMNEREANEAALKACREALPQRIANRQAREQQETQRKVLNEISQKKNKKK